ncbi:hypothetical protein JCM11641_004586 [Rhodosporidiobolus odoratus]
MKGPTTHTLDSSTDSVDPALELYLLTLLSDSNLPTGGFVASSGLESYIQHGYLSFSPPTASAPDQPQNQYKPAEVSLLAFIQHSLHTYARLNASLLRSAHDAVWRLRTGSQGETEALEEIIAADQLCEALTLNHVARRASVAQGGAHLTLYERAFAPPSTRGTEDAPEAGDTAVGRLVKEYRVRIRRTASAAFGGKDVTPYARADGHMTIAFGVLTAGVGLGISSALPLLLFLHARSLLSSAVRLNTIGPYSAHRMLLWEVRRMVDEAVRAVALANNAMQDESQSSVGETLGEGAARAQGDLAEQAERRTGTPGESATKEDWWDDDPSWTPMWSAPAGRKEAGATEGPVTTWPLGEIIATRHEGLFTKVFNS